MMPELFPGRKINIESALCNGFAIIESVHFEGANFGNTWDVERQCVKT